jgi:hypothetical protein
MYIEIGHKGVGVYAQVAKRPRGILYATGLVTIKIQNYFSI